MGMCFPTSKIPQKVLQRHLCLAEDALESCLGQIETVVSGNGDTQMRLGRMAQLRVAAGLMMNLKSGLQEGAQNFFGLQNRQTRKHLSRQRDAQLFSSGALFV